MNWVDIRYTQNVIKNELGNGDIIPVLSKQLSATWDAEYEADVPANGGGQVVIEHNLGQGVYVYYTHFHIDGLGFLSPSTHIGAFLGQQLTMRMDVSMLNVDLEMNSLYFFLSSDLDKENAEKTKIYIKVKKIL